MNSERAMTKIVRGTGALCWLIAAWQLLGVLAFLWEKRSTLGSVGGYGNALLPVGLLFISGIFLWAFAARLARWLCQEPVRRKSRPVAVPEMVPSPHEDDE